jgi:hypothetical protein
LNGTILKEMESALRKAVKLTDAESIKSLQSAKSAVRELADLMTVGYGVRIVADYEPDVKIEDRGTSRFSLNGVNISVAHDWPDRARALSGVVSKGWKAANG